MTKVKDVLGVAPDLTAWVGLVDDRPVASRTDANDWSDEGWAAEEVLAWPESGAMVS